MTPTCEAVAAGLPPGAPRHGAGGEGLRVPRGVLEALARDARRARPHEACALLLGLPGRSPRVLRVLPAANLAADPRSAFEVDPGAVVGAERVASAAGLALLGFWHSHPDGAPRLSRADVAAAWGGFFHLVTAVTGEGACATRGWLATGSGIVEARLLPDAARPDRG